MFNDVENSYCKADLENLCSWDFKEGEMETLKLGETLGNRPSLIHT
jgi:hypothetical protein